MLEPKAVDWLVAATSISVTEVERVARAVAAAGVGLRELALLALLVLFRLGGIDLPLVLELALSLQFLEGDAELFGLLAVLAVLEDEAARERGAYDAHAEQTGDDLVDMGPDADEHDRCQRTDRPVGAVLEVDVLVQRSLADQVDRDRPDEHRTDEAEAEGDDDRVGRDRESADDAVERERCIQELEVEERHERRLTGQDDQLGRCRRSLDGFLFGLFLGLDVEHLAERVDTEVGQQPEPTCDEDGHGVAGDEECDERDGGGGHDDRCHVEEAELGVLADEAEGPFDPVQPVNVAVLEDVVQEQHPEERAAEGVDLRAGLGHDVAVGAGLVRVTLLECEHERLPHPDLRSEADDEKREDEAHAEHGDEDADGEEDLLPEPAHLAQHGGVDHRVVERERHLEDAEEDAQDQSIPTAVDPGSHQGRGRYEERPAEDSPEHRVPFFGGVVVSNTGTVLKRGQ